MAGPSSNRASRMASWADSFEMSQEGEITVLSSGDTLATGHSATATLANAGPSHDGRGSRSNLNISMLSASQDEDGRLNRPSLSSPTIYRGKGQSGSSPLSSPKHSEDFLAGGGLFKSQVPVDKVTVGTKASSEAGSNDSPSIEQKEIDASSQRSEVGDGSKNEIPLSQLNNKEHEQGSHVSASSDDAREKGNGASSSSSTSTSTSLSRGSSAQLSMGECESEDGISGSIEKGPPRVASTECPKAKSTGSSMSKRPGLFCLEIFVHETTWDKNCRNKGMSSDSITYPCNPTVAFRFLDFPSQHIFTNNAQNTDEPKEKRPQRFVFERGKSCLLESSPAELYARCMSTPLYVMFLDKKVSAQKLLGAVVIDLADYVATASTPGVTAHPPESHYGAEGFIRSTYSLLSLVGRKVGSIDMTLRIRNLGKHMLAHWRSMKNSPQTMATQPQTDLHQRPDEDILTSVTTKRTKTKTEKKRRTKKRGKVIKERTVDPAKVMTALISQKEADRERALKAAVDAIARKRNAKPGVDGEMLAATGQSQSSPPPLYYYNDGSDSIHDASQYNHNAFSNQDSVGSPKRHGKINTSMSPGSALGPGEHQNHDANSKSSSQRRGTYFGTYTKTEAMAHKAHKLKLAESKKAASRKKATKHIQDSKKSRGEQVSSYMQFPSTFNISLATE